MIARVAALGLGIVGQAALEVGAGQVVQEQVVGEAEQVAALLDQVVFDGGLVSDQAEAAIQAFKLRCPRGTPRSSGRAVLGSQ